MTCKVISPNTFKICRRDKRHKIIIQCPGVVANNSPGAVSTVQYQDILSVWAMIKTISRVGTGELFVDGVNINQTNSIEFYFDYTTEIDISRKLWVLFDDKRYEVSEIQNIDKRNVTYKFTCVLKGDKDIVANQR
jgi:hypothetical protein